MAHILLYRQGRATPNTYLLVAVNKKNQTGRQEQQAISMRIRSRFLLWVNGALLLLWGLYFIVDEISEREGMLRHEVRELRGMAGQIRELGFANSGPLPGLGRVTSAITGESPGTEVMVLDSGSRVIASSIAGRLGSPWREPDITEVLRGDAAFVWKVHDHRHGDVPVLDVTLAVRGPPDSEVFAIHVARRLDAVEEKLSAQRWTRGMWALVSMLLMGLVISLVSHRWLLLPLGQVMDSLSGSRWFQPPRRNGDELQRLRATVQQMVQDADSAVDERDELLRQVRSFNRDLEQKIAAVRAQLFETQTELVEKERLSAVGELAAGLAHELRTPMHIVRAAAELLADDEANQQACHDIFAEVDRVSRLVDDLLLFTRPFAPVKESTRVLPVLRSAVNAARRSAAQGEADIKVDCPEDLGILVGDDHLRQVVFNLVSNAAASTQDGGRVQVEARDADGGCVIRVEDNGPGIKAEDLDRLFAPFFTRRPGGTGLGLAIVRRLVDLYSGAVTVRSRPGEGATFVVSFPRPQQNEE